MREMLDDLFQEFRESLSDVENALVESVLTGDGRISAEYKGTIQSIYDRLWACIQNNNLESKSHLVLQAQDPFYVLLIRMQDLSYVYRIGNFRNRQG